jgi:geranylgeranyl diphosphate synthase type II
MIEKYSAIIRNELDSIWPELPEPKSLYEPILYTLKAGGKRMRPVMLLAACDYYKGNLQQAAKAACGIELFHNFTLLHDDIMDNAELRRGRQTVYKRNGLNTAILSGDLMMVKVYQLLAQMSPELMVAVLPKFNDMAIKVCEGQQMDAEFETRNDVSIDEYLQMITYKSAVLPAAALQIGAVCGGASDTEVQKFYDFGIEVGIAFQIKDDWLDVFGDPGETGKVKGGDILAGKKSMPVLLTLSCLDDGAKDSFLQTLHGNAPDKVEHILSVMYELKIDEITRQWADKYFKKSLASLESIAGDDAGKNFFRTFADSLMERKN